MFKILIIFLKTPYHPASSNKLPNLAFRQSPSLLTPANSYSWSFLTFLYTYISLQNMHGDSTNQLRSLFQMGTYLAIPATNKNIVTKECPSQGVKFTLCEMQGWRREMEDAVVCETDIGDGNSLFAVFDGHGGLEVSSYARDLLIPTLKNNTSYKNRQYETALTEIFLQIDQMISSDEGEQNLAKYSSRRRQKPAQTFRVTHTARRLSETAGSTAHVVLITPDKYIVANTGDSRSILCRINNQPQLLSCDHKPENSTEYQRIIQAGGKVERGRINNGLNLSRCLGDFHYKQNPDLPREKQLIICDPDIRVFERLKTDKFMLIGCDGIFQKYYYNQEPLVQKILKSKKKGLEPDEIMSDILDSLLAKDTRHGLGCDNMTSILVEFN